MPHPSAKELIPLNPPPGSPPENIWCGDSSRQCLSIIPSNTCEILIKGPGLKLLCFQHFPGLQNKILYLHWHNYHPKLFPPAHTQSYITYLR